MRMERYTDGMNFRHGVWHFILFILVTLGDIGLENGIALLFLVRRGMVDQNRRIIPSEVILIIRIFLHITLLRDREQGLSGTYVRPRFLRTYQRYFSNFWVDFARRGCFHWGRLLLWHFTLNRRNWLHRRYYLSRRNLNFLRGFRLLWLLLLFLLHSNLQLTRRPLSLPTPLDHSHFSRG